MYCFQCLEEVSRVVEFELHGFRTEYSKNAADQKHGLECGYDSAGNKIYEAHWYNGKQVGNITFTDERLVEYDIAGNKIEYSCNSQKQKHGLECGYNPKGQKVYEVQWFDGKQLGSIVFV